MKKKSLYLAAAALAGTVSLSTWGIASAQDAPAPSPQNDGKLPIATVTEDYTPQLCSLSDGSLTIAVDQATDKLSEVQYRHPDETSGVAISNDCQKAQIYVKTANGEAAKEIQKISAAYPGIVEVIPVRYSLNDFEAVAEQIDDEMFKVLDLNGCGGDPRNDRFEILVRKALPATMDELSPAQKKAILKLKSLPVETVFKVDPGEYTNAI